jgi:hypothetical protein
MGSLPSHPRPSHRFSRKLFFVHEYDFKMKIRLPSRFLGLAAFMRRRKL